jgi:hypothetical protein
MREFAKVLMCLAGAAGLTAAASGQVVISQVYSGGGGASSTYRYDYVELFNRGNTPVDISGWSLQYASASGNFSATQNTATLPSGVTLQPGQYYLVQTGSAGTGGTDLPVTPDHVTSQLSMAAAGAKVVLISDNNYLTTSCPTGGNVVDFLGWGPGNCAEGTAGPGTSATTAVFRANNGCTDTDNNAADFAAGAPAPRNSASPFNLCGGGSTPPSGVGASDPASACPGQPVILTVTVTEGVPASPIVSVIGDTSQIGGMPGEVFVDDGTFGDAVWTLSTTIFTSTTGPRPIPVVITDAMGREGAASPVVEVLFCGLGGFFSAEPLCTGGSTLLTFQINPAQYPDSTGITAQADLSSIGGPSSVQLFDDGTNGDAVAGDNVFSLLYAAGAVPPGSHSISASAQDAEGRSITRNTTLNVGDCTQSDSTLVISAIYGAGGNNGSNYTHDYVELFNRGSSPVSLDGLSIQYASGETDANGLGVSGPTRMTVLPNGVTLQPGQYYLVKMAGSDGPVTPDFVGEITMSADRGTIALVNGTTPLGTDSCGDASILDLVGYGNGSTPASRGYCREGDFHAPTLNATTGLIRRDGGCWDTDNNGMDFVIYTPAPRNSASPFNPCSSTPTCGTADFDGDGDVGTDADIEAFFACLAGNCCDTCFELGADFNADGDVGTDADIEAFFRVLAGGNC